MICPLYFHFICFVDAFSHSTHLLFSLSMTVRSGGTVLVCLSVRSFLVDVSVTPCASSLLQTFYKLGGQMSKVKVTVSIQYSLVFWIRYLSYTLNEPEQIWCEHSFGLIIGHRSHVVNMTLDKLGCNLKIHWDRNADDHKVIVAFQRQYAPGIEAGPFGSWIYCS